MKSHIKENNSIPKIEDIEAKEWLDNYIQEVKRKNIIKAKGKYFTSDEPLRFVLYARKSTKPEDSQASSEEDQINACTKYAVREGYNIVEILQEAETAFKEGKREAFYQMLDEIKNVDKRKYNAILTWAPDRLARNMKDAGEIIDLLDKGIIRDIKFPEYYFVNDANGKMALGIQFVIAKQHSENDSTSTKRGNRSKLERGEVLQHYPWGYTVIERNNRRLLIKDEKNFNLLREACMKIIEGYTLSDAVNYLVDNEFTHTKGSKNVTVDKLSTQLSRPVYAGYYVIDELVFNYNETVDGFEPLLSPLEFMKLRLRLGEKQIFQNNGKRNKVEVLRKLIKCEYCNRHMTPSSPRGRRKSYLNVVCMNEACIRHTENAKGKLKQYPKQVSGRTIFAFIKELVLNRLEIPKEAYDEYVSTSESTITQYQNSLEQDINSLKARYINLTNKYKVILEQYAKHKDKDIEDELEDTINKKTIVEKQKVAKEEELQKINLGITQRILTYEEFLNTIRNIGNIIEKAEKQGQVQGLLEMLFLNIWVDSRKVSKYQLKPPFEKYVKMGTIVNGATDGARTRDNWYHKPGLYQLSYDHHISEYPSKTCFCQLYWNNTKLLKGIPNRPKIKNNYS